MDLVAPGPRYFEIPPTFEGGETVARTNIANAPHKLVTCSANTPSTCATLSIWRTYIRLELGHLMSQCSIDSADSIVECQ